MPRLAPISLLGLALLMASGCAATASPEDPLEPFNRGVFAFNQKADRYVVAPVANAYGRYVPDLVKQGARNVFSNLGEPFTFLNDVLQGERERAGESFGRFFVNSTLGVFGLFDMASMMKVAEPHDEDLGQTLAVWGVGSGPYIVLPLLGPSTLRDFGAQAAVIGSAIAGVPLNPAPLLASGVVGPHVGDGYGPTSVVYGGIDTRYQLDPVIQDLNKGLDPYTTYRTSYLQNRAQAIRNGGSVVEDPSYQDLFNEDLQ